MRIVEVRLKTVAAMVLFCLSCTDGEQILHYPDPPPSLPYDGLRKIVVTTELPPYMVPGQSTTVTVRLLGDGVPLPAASLGVHLEKGSATVEANDGTMSSGAASPDGPQKFEIEIRTSADGSAAFELQANSKSADLVLVVEDLCTGCVETTEAESAVLDTTVTLKGVGTLIVSVRTSEAAPCTLAELRVYRETIPCRPDLAPSGFPTEVWLDPRNPPLGLAGPATLECKTLPVFRLDGLEAGAGYGILVVGLTASLPTLYGCVDATSSDVGVTVVKDQETVVDVDLSPLPPMTEGTYAFELTAPKWTPGPIVESLCELLLRPFTLPLGAPEYVVSRFDEYFGWGLDTVVGVDGSLEERCIAAVADLQNKVAPEGLVATPLLEKAAWTIDSLLAGVLDGCVLRGYLTLGPILPMVGATGQLKGNSLFLTTGEIAFSGLPFDFSPAASVAFTFDPVAVPWAEGLGGLTADGLQMGEFLKYVFQEHLEPVWADKLGISQGGGVDPAALHVQSLFRCNELVPVLDAVDCTSMAVQGKEKPWPCETDGLWVGPVRYPRYELEDACAAIVSEDVGKLGGAVLGLGSQPAVRLETAGRLAIGLCKDGQTVCWFDSKPAWDMGLTGEPLPLSPAAPAVVSGTREEGSR